MADFAIQFDQVYKKFPKGTLRPREMWQKLLGLRKDKGSLAANEFYALEDINLTIKHGEIWGIVGNNGAGKSTMLKLAARIYAPSRGLVKGYGKVTGVLEVGAGFNYDLTGRENIFLTGYMLGMTRNDIQQQLDDIISFSGIGTFVDTPIKSYSSGMYLRLAFAVAAFLRTQVMVVDEVLAVGDIRFQEQCLNRMKENSSNLGTTVLFVSHNLYAVRQICRYGVWLENGKMADKGPIEKVANAYVQRHFKQKTERQWLSATDSPGNEYIRLRQITLLPQQAAEDRIDTRTPLDIKLVFDCLAEGFTINLGLHLFSGDGLWVFDVPSSALAARRGTMEATCSIPGNFLNDGAYKLSVIFVRNQSGELFYLRDALSFQVEDYRENTVWTDKWHGAVRPLLPFTLRYADGETITHLP